MGQKNYRIELQWSKFTIFTKNAIPKLTKKAEEIVKALDIQIIEFTDKDDEENRMSKIFETYKLILIRPDRYVYGGIESLDDSSDIIESLESTFFFKNMKALLFPGQGVQKIGMLDEIINSNKEIVDYLSSASKNLDFDLIELISSGPEEKLNLTEFAQPAILATSIAIAKNKKY